MLEYLKIEGVGPAPEIELEIAPRMNFLTGDNGLGKTFILDIAWWVLTGSWVGMPALPHQTISPRGSAKASRKEKEKGRKPRIKYRYLSYENESLFDRSEQSWPFPKSRPIDLDLVVYARSDGSFSVWDTIRNREGKGKFYKPERPPAFIFSPDEVWNGLAKKGTIQKLCNGLIHDWAAWQRENGEAFQDLTSVLNCLAPSEKEPLTPGKLTRISVDDVRDHPTLKMPYGQDVALVHSAAGIRRIVALAYILVWAWHEHLYAVEMFGLEPVRGITFLIDEIEAHLHPQWQRRIVSSLLEVVEALVGDDDLEVQFVATTHSPLIMASLEPHFDKEKDALWELDLVDDKVEIRKGDWRPRGDVSSWLTSDVFDLGEARSLPAEKAIKKALEAMKDPKTPLEEIEKLHNELHDVLKDTDPFWVRWLYRAEKAGLDV